MIQNSNETIDVKQMNNGEPVIAGFETSIPQNDEPNKKPEVEPEKLPDENPGIITEPKPKRREDDDTDNDDNDDDDNDEFEPFSDPEIGDDPDEIKTKTTIM